MEILGVVESGNINTKMKVMANSVFGEISETAGGHLVGINLHGGRDEKFKGDFYMRNALTS